MHLLQNLRFLLKNLHLYIKLTLPSNRPSDSGSLPHIIFFSRRIFIFCWRIFIFCWRIFVFCWRIFIIFYRRIFIFCRRIFIFCWRIFPLFFSMEKTVLKVRPFQSKFALTVLNQHHRAQTVRFIEISHSHEDHICAHTTISARNRQKKGRNRPNIGPEIAPCGYSLAIFRVKSMTHPFLP